MKNVENQINEEMEIAEAVERIELTLGILESVLPLDDEEKKSYIESLIVNEEVKAGFISSCFDILDIAENSINLGTPEEKAGAILMKKLVKEVVEIATQTPSKQTHEDLVNGVSKIGKYSSNDVPTIENLDAFRSLKRDIEPARNKTDYEKNPVVLKGYTNRTKIKEGNLRIPSQRG